ncbi:MAG TPA: malto-oligosyltrehalose synthase [Acidimicrobiales bacterium]|nr:malto-oligosyltrehalose synthase [Acidimicrobiales bacterium]
MTLPVRATYRVQLQPAFTFDDAAGIVGYLAELGVSHLYCSPYLQAAPGSTHGYDVVDHHRLNAELGGDEGYRRMAAALREHGMAQVLDIVPNHMATAGRHNAWWWDVLENGPASQYAAYFDIDWDPPERKLIAQVLVPILGGHYGRVLEAGEIRLARDGGSFTIHYFENELPVSPRSIDDLVARAADRVGSDELASVATALGRLPHALLTDRRSVLERHRDKEVLRARLAQLAGDDPAIADALDAEVDAVNRDPDSLDALLERQNYRLAYWRVAGRELDYRRFFDINTLVALRMEDPVVFDDTHELLLDLVARGDVEGLRIDHVDGLRDPQGYLDRLRAAAGDDAIVVVEKILEGDERLPEAWPVQGTSGYDFLVEVNTLLVDPGGEDDLTAVYARFAGETAAFAELALRAKQEIMRGGLAADVERLTQLFALVAERHRRYRDFTRSELRDALRETIAGFDVYRTYVRPGDPPREVDVHIVERATAAGAERRPDLDPDLFHFLRDVLLLRSDGDIEAELAIRFQQTSAPVMAKGVEDTAFYRYNRMVALNEVGGDPGRVGMTAAEWHERRAGDTGAVSLLATSTHDTKRSEDVRARLAVLAELPGAWEEAVWRWAHHNDRHRSIDATAGVSLPDRNAEYLLYQTLVGAWPLTADRAVAYMEKAAKEAKVHTSWIDPVPAYDDALRSFVGAVVTDEEFVADLEAFLAENGIVEAGRRNSLAQVALKLTCPGLPDIYQGCELWDLSLVDPDNRRPVDFDARRNLLREVRDATLEDVLTRMDEGAPKLWLVHRLLRLRAERPELFAPDAGYERLAVDGSASERVVAFCRAGRLVVAVTRFPLSWPKMGSTSVALPQGSWVSALTGRRVGGDRLDVAAFVPGLPVEVLVAEP